MGNSIAVTLVKCLSEKLTIFGTDQFKGLKLGCESQIEGSVRKGVGGGQVVSNCSDVEQILLPAYRIIS